MDYTPNFHLSQWGLDDPILHTDFNADNLAIDAALLHLGNCKMHAGHYVGTGSYGTSAPTQIALPFRPTLLILSGEMATSRSDTNLCCWLFSGIDPQELTAMTMGGASNGTGSLQKGTCHTYTWDEESKTFSFAIKNRNDYDHDIYRAAAQANKEGAMYHYIAFGIN